MRRAAVALVFLLSGMVAAGSATDVVNTLDDSPIAARGAGPLVFRQGTFADEAVGWPGNVVKGKQWAAENPLTAPNYAKRYGLPAENATPDWVVGGRMRGPYEVRPAPASHNNPLNTGGAPEYVPRNPEDVILEFFHMPD
ncbi:MAG: hypothetical protein IT386_08805 [Deltaproteobacteria bacterium]|nr:hypothetical protein [Deltaproteobacteria bacterium]